MLRFYFYTFLVLCCAFLSLLPSVASAEDMTITTYYPSPNGAYDALNVKRLSVGDTNGDGSINASDVSPSSGYLLVADKLGIGTTTPSYTLHVQGISAFSDRLYKTRNSPGESNPTLIGAETEWGSGEIPIISLGYNQGAVLGTEMDTKIRSYARNPAESQNYIIIGRSRTDISGTVYMPGNVGIGNTSPTQKLEVNGKIISQSDNWSLYSYNSSGDRYMAIGYYPERGQFELATYGSSGWETERLAFLPNVSYFLGNVGIGTATPSQKLDVAGNMILNSSSAVATLLAGAANTGTSGNLSIAARDGDVMFRFWTDSGIAQINTAEGGSWSSASFDLAEMINYENEASIEPGDIIVSTGNKGGKSYADKSSYPYQETIIGIVSTQPAFVGGVPWEDNTINSPVTSKALSLAGRVPTKVCTENGPIKIGDYLTSSLIPGVSMKATKSGQVVGKAMEEYKEKNPKKVGKITVFVNPVWFGGDIQKKTESLEKTVQDQQKQIEELRKEIGVLRKGRPFKWIPGKDKD